MEKKNLMSKIISGVLIGSVVMSMGITAFAYEFNGEESITEESTKPINSMMGKFKFKGKIEFKQGFRKGGEDLSETLKVLVEEGKVTQNTVDSMNKFIEAKMVERKEMVRDFKNKKPEPRRDVLVEMKEEGIITDEVIDAIRAKKEEMKEEKKNEMVSRLVEKGIITEEDKLEILDFMKAKMEERKAEFEKIRNMTVEERKAYLQENKKERIDNMSQLVDEGIITEEQANKIKENMPKHDGFKKGDFRKGPEGKRPFGQKGFNKNKDN